MKKCVSVLLTLATVFTLTLAPGFANAADPAPVKLVYATYIPNSLTLAKSVDWFLDEVARRSNGRVVFERYSAGALLPAADLFPALSRGAVDLALGSPSGYNSKEYPYSGIIMPYTTDKVDAIALGLNELYTVNADFRREFQGKGIELLWQGAFTENTLWTHKKIVTRADLRGLRLRSVGPIAVAYEALGATPVPMTPIDAVEAFKRGALDGLTTWPIDAAIAQGVDRIAEYVGDSGGMGIYAVLQLAANKRKFESLPPDVRKIFYDVAAETTPKYLAMVDSDVQAAAEALSKNSTISLVELAPGEAAAWRAIAAPKMLQSWIERCPDQNAAKAMLVQLNDIVRKYEKTSTYVTGLERYKKLKQARR